MKNNEEIYPQKMLRGISSKNFIVEGILTEDVFNLDPVREDGYCEISVTWYDNQEAFDVIPVCEAEGKHQFSRDRACSVYHVSDCAIVHFTTEKFCIVSLYRHSQKVSLTFHDGDSSISDCVNPVLTSIRNRLDKLSVVFFVYS